MIPRFSNQALYNQPGPWVLLFDALPENKPQPHWGASGGNPFLQAPVAVLLGPKPPKHPSRQDLSLGHSQTEVVSSAKGFTGAPCSENANYTAGLGETQLLPN